MTPDSPVQNEDAEVSSLPTAVYPDVPAPPVAAAPMPAPASTPASAPRHPSTHLSDLEASQAPAEVQTSHILPDRAAASHRYVLTAFHARGGMGEVWRCLDSSIGREVALKRLTPSRSGARDRFLHEAQVTGQLEHPSIVPVHDIGFDDNGQPFYVMKLVRGRTLKAAIEEFHAPPEERLKGAGDGENSQSKPSAGESRSVRRTRLLKTFLDLCHAVAYAHSRGVIHRDLKPDNVMLGAFGETVVLDWGLAKLKNQPAAAAHESPCALTPALSGQSADTEDGSILGSPLYMPPEMAEGHTSDADQRTDVYLLGATLYELLAGRPPRQGANRDELLELARTTPPAPPRKLAADTPRALEAICLKAMSRARGHRYGTALALADDIQRFLAGEPVRAYREPLWMRAWRWVRQHRRGLARAVAVALVLLCVGAAMMAYAHARALEARDQARGEVQRVRRLIDEARFYATSTDAPGEASPYYDPARGQQVAAEARAAVAPWGPQLEKLPIFEEREPLGAEMVALSQHLDARARGSASAGSGVLPVATAQEMFLQAESARAAPRQEYVPTTRDGMVDRARLHRAIALYQSALNLDPRHYWARFQLGRAYLELGRNPEAIEALSGCVALRPQTPWGYVARAMALAVDRRFDEAHSDLDRALALAPDALPARLNRVIVFRIQNDAVRAAAECDALLSRAQPPPEAAVYRAQLFLRADQPQKAVDLLNRHLEGHPRFTAGYLVRAQALLALNRRIDEVVGDLDRLVASATQPARLDAARGRVLRYLAAQLPRKQQRAALDLAEVELGKAIQETDASAETYADLGAVLHRQGEHRRAVIAFSRAITMDRSDPQLLVNRGWSQEALNHLNEALADFTAALAVAPACPEALAGLGFVEARLGDLPSAQRHASLALLHAKNDYLIMHNTACIYAQLAILDPANARVHEDAAISMLSQARDQWRTRVAGPSELELIALESAFGPALRARPEFKALVSQ